VTSPEAADPQVRLPDLENRLVDPVHEASTARATVVLFLSTDFVRRLKQQGAGGSGSQ
jgi:hypothetical protein